MLSVRLKLCYVRVCVLVVERLLLMLSVRIKGSAVRIAIICGTETCGWLRTERDIEWKLWMKAVYAKHHRSQDAVRQNLHTTGKRFGVYLSQ